MSCILSIGNQEISAIFLKSFFFHETMLGGYSEDRVFRYEDGGVAKSHWEITVENGQIVSKGSIGIPEDSLIHTKIVNSPVPPQEPIAPYKNGVRSTGEMFEFLTEEESFQKT